MSSFEPEALIEAVPYLLKFKQKIVVIKMGGSFLDNEIGQSAFIKDAALLRVLGLQIVIVHGGGKRISEKLAFHGIESHFVDGYRITDDKTMDVVEMTLSGSIGKNIVNQLQLSGVKAVGLNGKDGQMMLARSKVHIHQGERVDLGHVGEIVSVDTALIRLLLKEEYVPVISPIGYDGTGRTYNLNADTAAAAIAGALQAEKLILMTDVDGVYKAYPNPDSLIREMSLNHCRSLIEHQAVAGGMIPKLSSVVEALESGVKSAHIINGSRPHSLITEIFSHEGIGTMISAF